MTTESQEAGDVSDREYARSQYREKMVEHLFVAEMWKEAWFRRNKVIEVLRSEVDASGFDLLLECNNIRRHVQLKASRKGAAARHQKVNMNLEKREGGCVIWIQFDGNAAEGLTWLGYRFFGGKPGENLPKLGELKIARHTKPNMSGVKAERPAIRILPRSKFTPIESSSKLFAALFGD